MDSAIDEQILNHLREVDAQRLLREQQPGLGAKVQALKRYQQQRFANTYADLLISTRYQGAAEFFLKELYGPGDYTRRDAQFARVVPALVKLFPAEVVDTVARLARLHAISERLDTLMADKLNSEYIDAQSYQHAWQACQEQGSRQLQIQLTVAVGESLERLTRKPVLRHALRLMRGPATGAGMGELQAFLESGFDTFRAMKGAAEFLHTVQEREQKFAEAMYPSGEPVLNTPVPFR
ncbi:FFLEELY motif protein [Roseateles oligotrophus]|uniref:DUF8198 domain-containing protein n=1 Tax=Roseateles oligotrophus TaxID=1769250 RepID=A0ABT2YHE7_9BURK|nr:hypothetical protein [Roseateles oligotrophus]MCV2369485.1 hypothetical protein [Roseateles oligotrophus]